MTTYPRRSSGFSLIEVTLAIGIVGFALLSVFSLFSVSVQTNALTVDQVEALSAIKALPAYLQSVTDKSTPPNQGFVTVYGWMSNASNPIPVASSSKAASAPLLYAYNNPIMVTPAPGPTPPQSIGLPGQSVVVAVPVPVDPSVQLNVSQNAAKRQGQLYGIYLSVSPNFPIGSTAYPTAATLANYQPGPSPTPNYPEVGLALQVKVYTVPQVGVVPAAGTSPVFTYDLILPR